MKRRTLIQWIAALPAVLPFSRLRVFAQPRELTREAIALLHEIAPTVLPASIGAAQLRTEVDKFVAWTRGFQGPLNFGSAGIGSGGHLAGELYKQMAGVKAEHIPYKGSGPALSALLANEYHFNFAGLQPAHAQVRAGRLRGLAVTTPKRIAALPDMPAVAEALPGFAVVGWYGVLGPANLPRPIVTRLHDELVRILNTQEIRDRILSDGSEPVGSSPEEFRQFMLADLAKWAKVVKESGATMD